MKDLYPIITGAAAGALISYVPYGYFLLPIIIILTIASIVQGTKDKDLRDSYRDERKTTFYFVLCVTIAIFYAMGVNTFIPKMNENDVQVGQLVGEWHKIHPNADINCDKNIAKKRIYIHTITRITLKEALDLIEEKADARASYDKKMWGRSIAGGPRIKVEIHPGNPDDNNSYHPQKPYYEGVQ